MKVLLIIAAALVAGGGVFVVVTRDDDGRSSLPAETPVDPSISPTPEETATSSPSPVVSPPPADTGDADALRMDGIGPIVVGMTVEELEVATGERWRVFSDFSPSCRYSQPYDGTPENLNFMLSHRRLVRIDVEPGAKVETVSGIGIGDREEKVLRVYGDDIRIEQHPYLLERGNYLIYQPAGEDSLLLIFETEEGRVLSFRSGYEQQVRYIEGCA